MIILSQDERAIVNFDNLPIIGLENKNEITTKIIAFTENNSIILASYKQEEKAKEVLNEILATYLSYMTDKNMSVKIPPKIYKMPDDKEEK